MQSKSQELNSLRFNCRAVLSGMGSQNSDLWSWDHLGHCPPGTARQTEAQTRSEAWPRPHSMPSLGGDPYSLLACSLLLGACSIGSTLQVLCSHACS
jgi:hypothetical protein